MNKNNNLQVGAPSGASNPETKVCCKCGIEKPLDGFKKYARSRPGRLRTCIECTNKRVTKWHKENPEKALFNKRVSHYTRTYKLPRELAEKLAAADRKGVCEICGEYSTLIVDHCHKSGKFRGFLCQKCNNILGMSDEKIIILKVAIQYIKTHTEEI